MWFFRAHHWIIYCWNLSNEITSIGPRDGKPANGMACGGVTWLGGRIIVKQSAPLTSSHSQHCTSTRETAKDGPVSGQQVSHVTIATNGREGEIPRAGSRGVSRMEMRCWFRWSEVGRKKIREYGCKQFSQLPGLRVWVTLFTCGTKLHYPSF